ncbi:hypothetical protein [Cellulosimicrobium sp. NPDC057862]|uniref:hypothetical protein n=1 Tax=Cellulosimicrobium sp. NPDC057862 TaxID=3346266 RepID=UPI0036702B81
MTRLAARAAALATAAVLAVLATAACTGGSSPDPTGDPATSGTADAPGPDATASPLVARTGWQVVGASGACVLSWRGASDPAPPEQGARDASAALLSETVAADGGDPVAPRDVLLPLTSDGVTLQGVNAVAQDWAVGTPRGEVQVRGAARVVSTPTFDGGASTQSVALALDCAGPLDEGSWQRLLSDVRVGLVAPLEEPGAWPS